VSFDVFGDPTGFRFTASTEPFESRAQARARMGDELTLAPGDKARLNVRTPVPARTVFYRDGQAVHEARDSTHAKLPVEQPGVYRVEVYLDQLGSLLDGKPWIISNPIFVR
jgi:hypothetical protein